MNKHTPTPKTKVHNICMKEGYKHVLKAVNAHDKLIQGLKNIRNYSNDEGRKALVDKLIEQYGDK